jgi:hypothetical protein
VLRLLSLLTATCTRYAHGLYLGIGFMYSRIMSKRPVFQSHVSATTMKMSLAKVRESRVLSLKCSFPQLEKIYPLNYLTPELSTVTSTYLRGTYGGMGLLACPCSLRTICKSAFVALALVCLKFEYWE